MPLKLADEITAADTEMHAQLENRKKMAQRYTSRHFYRVNRVVSHHCERRLV